MGGPIDGAVRAGFVACAQVDDAVAADARVLRRAGSEPDRCVALGNLAISLYSRFRCQADPRDLEAAIQHLRTVTRTITADHPEFPTVQGNLGMMVAARQTLDSSREAIGLWRAAVARTPAGSAERAALTGQLGQGAYQLFQHTGDPQLLDEAADNLTFAVQCLPADAERDVLRVNLAVTLVTRHQLVRPDRAELDCAIGILESLLSANSGSLGLDVAGTARTYLAQALSVRYADSGDPADFARWRDLEAPSRTGPHPGPPTGVLSAIDHDVRATEALFGYLTDSRQHDVDRAVEEQEAALAQCGTGDLQRVPLTLNLALTLTMRHHARRTDLGSYQGSDDLTRAIRIVEDAMSGEVPAVYRGVGLAQLGSSLLDRHLLDPGAGTDDLLAARRVLQAALANPLLDRQSRIGALSRSAYCELVIGRATGDPAAFRRAVGEFREVVEALPEDSPLAIGALGTLAEALFVRAESESGATADLEEAIGIARRICAEADTDRAAAFLTARTWGDSAWRRGVLSEAAEAYTSAVNQLHEVVALQTGRAHQSVAVRQAEGMAARAAYALGVGQDPAAAATVLETGRALMLTSAMERGHPDLSKLDGSEHANVAAHFGRLAAEVAAAERTILFSPGAEAGTTGDRDTYRRALDQLRQTAQDVRRIPGFENFLGLPGPADLAEVADRCGNPLVYLVATDRGGLAVIVRPDHGSTAFTATELPAWTSDFERDGLSRLYAATADTDDFTASEDLFEQLTLDLWTAVMQPVARAAGSAPQLVLIPCGRTGMLPLHAAARPDSSAVTGLRHLADDVITGYAPSARALSIAMARGTGAPTSAAGRILAVHDPSGTSGPELLMASVEVDLIGAAAGDASITRIHGNDATRARLLELLPHHEVFHAACHGLLSPDRPLDGGLVLSGDQILSVRDLVASGTVNARLAVLSSCDSARIDEGLPDEVLSLATAFLQAGFAAVVAASWPTEDAPAAAQMALTYRYHLTGGEPLPTALNRAALWIRDTTNGEKARTFPELFTPTAEDLTDDPGWADRRDHSSPLVWAVFTHTGFCGAG